MFRHCRCLGVVFLDEPAGSLVAVRKKVYVFPDTPYASQEVSAVGHASSHNLLELAVDVPDTGTNHYNRGNSAVPHLEALYLGPLPVQVLIPLFNKLQHIAVEEHQDHSMFPLQKVRQVLLQLRDCDRGHEITARRLGLGSSLGIHGDFETGGLQYLKCQLALSKSKGLGGSSEGNVKKGGKIVIQSLPCEGALVADFYLKA